MKHILSALLFLGSFSWAIAGHLCGAELFFDHLGNGSYRIHLRLFQDNFFPPSWNSPTSTIQIINGANTSNLTLPLDSVVLQNSCFPTINVLYYSAVVQWNTIPTSGLVIQYTDIQFNSPDNLYTPGRVEAMVYPQASSTQTSSGPRFRGVGVSLSTQGGSAVNATAWDPDTEDSTFTELVPAIMSTGYPVSFAPGYSYSEPIGPGLTTLHPRTGVLEFAGAAIPAIGQYGVASTIRSYRDGVLTGTCMRYVTMTSYGSGWNPDLLVAQNVVSTADVQQAGQSMWVNMFPGESLDFQLMASGEPGNLLTLRGEGPYLVASAGTVGNCSGPGCATLVPNGGSFSGTGSVAAQFSFTADSSLFQPNADVFYTTFHFWVTSADTSGCTKSTPYVVHIRLKQPGLNFWGPSGPLSICRYSSIQGTLFGDTSNVVWSPTTGVSNPTSGSPMLNPVATTTYTVTNLNNNTSLQVTVHVDTMYLPTLIDDGKVLTLVHGNKFTEVAWNFDGIPLRMNSSDMITTVPGEYRADVAYHECQDQSNAVVRSHPVIEPRFYYGMWKVVATDGWSEIEFDLTNVGFLDEIYVALPDSGAFKSGFKKPVLELKEQQTTVWVDTAIQQGHVFYGLNNLGLILQPGSYTLRVSHYGGHTVFASPIAVAGTHFGGLLELTGGRYADGGVIHQDAIPLVLMHLQVGFGGLSDGLPPGLDVYPNPAQSLCYVKFPPGTTGAFEWEAYDAMGKVVSSGTMSAEENELAVGHWPAGLYFVRMVQGATAYHARVMVE
jgi:hypothetical protein